MSDDLLTNREVANEVVKAGGILSAIENGLLQLDIADPKLAAVWEDAEFCYANLRIHLRDIERILIESLDEPITEEDD